MKKFLMVLAPFFFLISIFFFREAYSLFESNRVNRSDLNIAMWQIKINDDIISGSSSEFVIDSVNWTQSTEVKEGKAAPGMTGYFDIIIDPNDTETSVRYDITFDFSNLDSDQFTIDQIVEIDNKPIVRTGEFTYSNIITLDEIENNETNTIRVYLTWINNENNNEKDSALGLVHGNTLTIPVTVEATQHVNGETLVEYNGE